jgi:hypothetical protein
MSLKTAAPSIAVTELPALALPGGSHQTSETVSEVIEMVEGALPDKLFQPPDGYQRVNSFPFSAPPNHRAATHTWGELLQAHWKMFEDWWSSLSGNRANR